VALKAKKPRSLSSQSKRPLGDCYDAAGKYILYASKLHMGGGEVGDAEGLILVHAEVNGQGPLEGTTFGHALVIDTATDTVIDKSNGRDLHMPKDLYYAIAGIPWIDNYFEYTPEQMMKNLVKYRHWGPWDLKTRSGL